MVVVIKSQESEQMILNRKCLYINAKTVGIGLLIKGLCTSEYETDVSLSGNDTKHHRTHNVFDR